MAEHYVDLSVFNPDPATIDWRAYKTWSNIVALRSSYGVGYVDNHYRAYLAGARAAGIDTIIHYHYAYPDTGNSPQAEADWQRQVVMDFGPNDLIMLDYEEPGGTAEWAYEWLIRQQSNFNRQPIIYSYSDFIINHLQDSRLAQFPLVFALWAAGNPPNPPTPWTSIAAWQYSDSLSGVPGFGGALLDGNLNFTLGTNMNTYSPNSSDFNYYFSVDPNGNWDCKAYNTVIIGGNRGLFSQLSTDGNTLPVIGLPRTNELYQQDSDGYSWSVQFFERGVMVYDPQHRQDGQPGFGSSYLGKYNQFMHLDPNYQPVKVPDVIVSDIQAIKTAGDKLATDLGAL